MRSLRSVDPSKPTFGMVHCEMAFRIVYEHYLRERRTEESISKSVPWIFPRLCSQYFTDHGTVLPPAVVASTRAMVVFQHENSQGLPSSDPPTRCL